MEWRFPDHATYLVVTIAVSTFTSIFTALRWKNSSAAKALFVLVLFATLWSLTYLLELSAVNEAAQFFANDLSYIPIVSVPVLLLVFVLVAFGYDDRVSRISVTSLFIVPFILLILVWTSKHHTLFYTRIDFVPEGNRNVMTVQRGVFYWVYIVYAYCCVFAATVLAFVTLVRSRGIYRLQAAAIAVGTIFPWIGSAIDLFYGKIGVLHALQLAFIITGIVFLLGIFQFRMIDLSPIGRHVLVDRMAGMMLAINSNENIVDVNPAFLRFVGAQRDELIGTKVRDALESWKEEMHILFEMNSDTNEITIPCDGQMCHFRVDRVPLHSRTSTHIGTLFVMSDITQLVRANRKLEDQLVEIKKLQQEIREQAIRDPLTGLHNRRFLEEIIHQMFAGAKRSDGFIGFLFADIDHFKHLNDSFGHQAGDAVLVNLSRILRSGVRESDVVCRYGGEEFLVVFPEADAQEIRNRAEEIRRRFQESPTTYAGQEILATFSGGVAAWPDHGDSVDTVIKAADDALYAAKTAGRNRIVIA